MKKNIYPITIFVLAIIIFVFFSLLSFEEKEVPGKVIVPEEVTITFEEEEEEEKVILSLVAPNVCKIGELVTLDASASSAASFEWKIKPESLNFVVIENGKRAFFSSSENGDYIFFVAAAKENAVSCIIHSLRVEGQPISDKFTTLIRSWLPKNSNPLLLEALSRSFEESAKAKDIETLIKMTAVANRAVLGVNLDQYKSFLISFSEYLQKNYQGKSLEEHVALWLKIAAALKPC